MRWRRMDLRMIGVEAEAEVAVEVEVEVEVEVGGSGVKVENGSVGWSYMDLGDGES